MELNIQTVAVTGEQDNQFVGLKIKDNKIEFHYPESYDLSSRNDLKGLRSDILAILRTVSLAKTKSKDFSSYNSQFKTNNIFPLSSYLWLINDYLAYGRYENKEKKFVEGIQGRINWKKTMRSNPIISKGNVIYTNIISEKKDQKDNVITEIYNCCVKRSMDAIGWLYGLTFDSNGVDYDFLFKNNFKYYLSVLATELTHVFDDNKKTRLRNMMNVLTGLDDELVNTREMVYGVDNYDYVYERMIDNMFSNVEEIKSFYPNATVDLVLEPKEINSSNLRPDTVMVDEENKKAYIIDAKNYRYGTTFMVGDIPETTSIQKQVTYGEYVRRMQEIKGEEKYTEIYSAFVMPYSMTRNKYNNRFNKPLEFVGLSSTKWYDSNESNNRKIVNILIDMKTLVNGWCEKSNADKINELTTLIEKSIENGVVR